ncbi:hypothetical protein F2Q69_00002194 [Brassica cretica]|uniref:Uncharacterized protein n=1 Tax=Brassica cretica TaxID=69181 RepID=A0A8S9P9F3_BRACR|nr:hypothetical protein F2Q69_00002194 [Brassica cretica]
MACERKTAIMSIAIFSMIIAVTATEADGRFNIRRSLNDFGGACCNVFIHTCCFPHH